MTTGKIVGEYHNLVLDKLKGNDKKIARFPSFMLKNLIIPKNKGASKPERNRTGKQMISQSHCRFLPSNSVCLRNQRPRIPN
jgi:hypothetical protein